jgi:acetylornithine/succinyldiaminopimelate/putrescine aminotransferase
MHIPLRQLFLAHVAQTSPAPLGLEIERAEGIWLYGKEGKRWIDFISGISVSNVGHRHPHVLAAIQHQLDRYMHLMVYGEYVQSPQVKLASALAEVSDGLDCVYFVNSGTEATEGALKLARRATGRTKLISFRNAYHGSTMGSLSLMSEPMFTDPFKPLIPDVIHLDSGDINALEAIDESTAAVVFECVRGEAGAIPLDQSYAEAIMDRCRSTGALLIADEIQSGFGRTGTFFAYQHYGIRPDIVLMAKGMGGGMPIGAFLAGRDLMHSLSNNPVLGHITTFGGHPVSCAAAMATLELIRKPEMPSQVANHEAYIRKHLQHPGILEISGRGLLLSARFRDEHTAQSVIRHCIENGLITDWFLFAPDRLRISPPLTISPQELELACDILLNAVEACCG